MYSVLLRISAGIAISVAAQAALAADGSFSLTANTHTVKERGVVDFTVSYHVRPLPTYVDDFLDENHYWYSYSRQSDILDSVWLEAAGRSFRASPSLEPNEEFAGTWNFSIPFPKAGHYDISLSGGWSSWFDHYSCVDYLPCGPGPANSKLTTGAFGPIVLSVEVVPEPPLWAMWLGGLAGTVLLRRRHVHSHSEDLIGKSPPTTFRDSFRPSESRRLEAHG